jgi:Kef-type K+ transport system membrane component KefB
VTEVDTGSFLAIVLSAALAAAIVTALPRRYSPSVVVVELLLGIVIGPNGLHLAHVDSFVEFFANLGLGMLFFFAGYEIDFDRVRGQALRLAGFGWLMSVALAYGIGGALEASGFVISFLFAGSALATTAIGTLIPILRDEGELRTRFGTFLLAAGAVGEFGPILLLTLVLSTHRAIHRALPLILFIALAVVIAVVSVRTAPIGWSALERSIESSNQLAVRLAALLVFGLAALAAQLGLDIVLGGFVAGMITRLAVRGREVSVLESKLAAVGFGLLIPFFFIVSGVEFDLDALLASPSALLKLPLFLVLFLVVRGLPAVLLYRAVLSARDRAALAFYCATALPLVVAIADVATDDGHMRSGTAAALIGAAILSTLIFPFVGRALRSGAMPAPLAQPMDDATSITATRAS